MAFSFPLYITYQFAHIEKVPLNMSIWAVLRLVVLVDQRKPKKAARHVDKDGLFKALGEVDGGRSIPIGRIDWFLYGEEVEELKSGQI